MRGIKFRALLRVSDDTFLDVGTASAVNPQELVQQIKRRRDEGEIDVTEESEVWIIPAKSFMKRMAVPTKHESTEEDGKKIVYKDEEDRKFGDTYLAINQLSERQYRHEGYVRAIDIEIAERLAASLRGGRMDGKKIIIVPEDTVNEYVIEPY